MAADEDSDSVFGSSVLSRIKAFESHGDNSNNSSRASSKFPSESSTRSNSRLNSSGGSYESTEEDWVNVNVGLGGTLGRPTLAPPLPGRKSSSSLSMSSGSLSHAPASSVSSFHSVSLSSDSIPVASEKEADTASLESEPYEDVDSTTSFGSPGAVARLTADWNQLKQNIPPQAPSRSASSSASLPASSSVNRRPPPPPPTSSSTLVGSTSDRSSTIGSTTSSINSSSTHSHNGYPPSYVPYKPKPPPPPAPHKSPLLPSKLPNSFLPPPNTNSNSPDLSTRATPIPPLARKRYEAVFDANLANYNLLALSGSSNTKPALLSPTSAMAVSGRDRKGWRGLSIDLVTASEELDMPGSELGSGDVLPGPIVRVIWSKSRLDNERLSAIWLQSDPARTGSLNREAFIKGMWRIDAELSTELSKSKTAPSRKSSTSTTASSLRTPTATPKRIPVPIPTPVQRNPSSSSSQSSTSSSHTSHTHAPGLRSVRSAGSLRRVPPPPVPIPGIPSPTPPLLPTRPPTRSTMASTTSPMIPTLPPPLPARKSTNQTGGMIKPEDELDLLL